MLNDDGTRVNISHSDKERDLGVTIARSLKPTEHINMITQKANSLMVYKAFLLIHGN